MTRIKRGYIREIPSDELKRDYRLFAIACEGAKREVEYFSQLNGISSRVVIEYIRDEEYDMPPSSPEHVLRRAEYYAQKYELNEEDSIWLVLDVDRWPKDALATVHRRCAKTSNWHMILSNPCFEVWLHFHTNKSLDKVSATSSAEFKTALNDQMPGGYNPLKYIQLVKDGRGGHSG